MLLEKKKRNPLLATSVLLHVYVKICVNNEPTVLLFSRLSTRFATQVVLTIVDIFRGILSCSSLSLVHFLRANT